MAGDEGTRHELPTIAIVGGGWAGLAAGVELADAGHPVTLYEAARHLGGRARSVAWNGVAIDNGQHLMAGAYTATLGLMERIGTTDRIERRHLEFHGRGFRLKLPDLPAPLHLAAGLITAHGLTLTDKIAAARFMSALKKHNFRLDRDITAAELLRQHKQPERLVARLWKPICLAALNTPLDIASAQVFSNVLRDSLAGARDASDLLFSRGDLGRVFPEAARAYIEARGGTIRLASTVTRITLEDDRFHLDGPDARADRVILASHPKRVADLLRDLPGVHELRAGMQGFAWQPILTLWLRFAAPIALPYPMIALGHSDDPWAFERNDLAPGLASIVASAEGHHLSHPPDKLCRGWLAQLRHQIGPLPALLDWKIIVEKRATFACTPGMWRPDNRTPIPGLYLAGDYTAGDYPATLEGAVRSGVKCAQLIIVEE